MATEYFEHITKIGERWDLIAFDYYGDAMLMHHILRANPDITGDPQNPTPLVFGAGVTLRIPVLPDAEIATAQLPMWKR